MARLTVAGATEVIIGSGLPEPLLPERPGRTKALIVTQPGATTVAVDVAGRLEREGVDAVVVGLPDREEAKTLAVAESVYRSLADHGVTRSDSVVGVGGGSVTDLAGFVAGTWLRGVEVIHVPTTLLAAVDASIGGKTGVNLSGKNLVGVFWHPSRVAISTDLLSSIPAYLVREGMAEVLKTGLIGDADLLQMLLESGLEAPLAEAIERSVRVKTRIVGADERESGVRAFLNFGHTIGHAIEFASTLPHGDSVAVGMVAAAYISREKAGFDQVDLVTRAVDRLSLPTEVSGLDVTRIQDLLRLDKKRDGGGLRMVLLRDVADPILTHVDSTDIQLGLKAIGL